MDGSGEGGDGHVPTRADDGVDRAATPSPQHAEYLDTREEWGARAGPSERAGHDTDVAPSGTEPIEGARPHRAVHVDEVPKKRVRGIARGVDTRIDQNNNEKLSFRVDRYDAGGNRLTPVPVEMRYHRGGLITDGDEVEVVGRWSRGTLRASRIVNLSTASEVRTWVPRGMKWVALALVVVAALLAAVLVGAGVLSTSTAGVAVSVPNVVGQNEAAALAAMRAKELTPQTMSEASDTIPKSVVIRTEPPADITVAKHASVNVVVSSGAAPTNPFPPAVPPPPQPGAATTVPRLQHTTTSKPLPTTRNTPAPATVPNVVGLSQSDATQKLRDAALSVTIVQQPNNSVSQGTVIRTDPAGTTTVPAESTVTLYVSTGPATTGTGPTGT